MKKAMTILMVATVALPMTGAAQDLPASVDLSSELPPVGDQGLAVSPGNQTCQSWAAAYYQLTQFIKHFNHPEWDLTNPRYRFSPAFANYSGGLEPYSALSSQGCVDMAEFNCDPQFSGPAPTAAQFEAAKPYKITSYASVWNNPGEAPFTNSQKLIDNAKEWLATGHLLDVAITIGTDFPDWGVNPPAHFYDPESLIGSLAIGYQVNFCGYDDHINPSGADPDRQGGFLMVNSWGTNWNGDMHGYLWMSYAYVKQYVANCTVITSVNPDTPAITGCSTNTGKAGDIITIVGNNFGAYRRASAVTFNGISAANVTFVNDAITATIPVGASSGPLIVYNWEGAPSNAIEFNVTPGPPTLALTVLGGDIFLQATGTAGKSLLFSTSTNLINWVPWALLPNLSGAVQLVDPAPATPMRFYRVEQP
jgi:hypothetical protein